MNGVTAYGLSALMLASTSGSRMLDTDAVEKSESLDRGLYYPVI